MQENTSAITGAINKLKIQSQLSESHLANLIQVNTKPHGSVPQIRIQAPRETKPKVVTPQMQVSAPQAHSVQTTGNPLIVQNFSEKALPLKPMQKAQPEALGT